MDKDEALEFIRANRRGVLSTTRRDGKPALTPVVAAVDDAGRVVVSTRETALKTANLRREPWATLLIMNDAFFGPWVQIEGTTEIVSLPDAMDLLIDYYRRSVGEHRDWDDYKAAMERERRVLLRIDVQRVGPNLRG